MVGGEPDDVRVKSAGTEWVVRVVEKGTATIHLFEVQTSAEAFADVERSRLGLPAQPPIDNGY
ncbi:hypothetical protein FJW07_31425 [Mesorhizobium sp. B3-1-9]|nr:hypothetical protein FJW07_31425 [Mesorhizobium sp. B3-1-9]TPI32615.1 hypothetical protein FJ414_21295 [Mesorhizobium sp. B3-1-6]TPI51214.1 hypothetical protein FJ424_33270 [Mesorhizobium sp. B3-1-8]TPI58259.1 hypothetical protein FJ420_33105 [Mesorhizobium sp. B3-1-3]TPJ36966.1 hypothetical protein FJ418_01395 [Mesorhizobium sp. B2-8-3]